MEANLSPAIASPVRRSASTRQKRTIHGRVESRLKSKHLGASTAPPVATRARADKTTADRLVDLDGFAPAPLLSCAPVATPFTKGSNDLVRRWETAKRYYETRIEWDMFDMPILLAANGGKGTKMGMLRVVAAGEQIEKALREIERRREAHGYVRKTR